jgi:hypothetical protein
MAGESFIVEIDIRIPAPDAPTVHEEGRTEAPLGVNACSVLGQVQRRVPVMADSDAMTAREVVWSATVEQNT